MMILSKKLNWLLTATLMVLGAQLAIAAPTTLQGQKNKVKIAVMGQGDFHPDRTVKGNITTLPDGLAARFIEKLMSTKRFDVVERSALRHVVREQGFAAKKTTSDLDKVIEATVDDLPDVNGWTVAAASSAANHNDQLKDFMELGSTVGADYIVYAVLEQQKASVKVSDVPFSDRGRKVVKNEVDARLRLRVIEVAKGRVIGADSIRTRISETAFSGRELSQDEYSMFDHLGLLGAVSVLDMVFPAQVIGEEPWVVNRGSNEEVSIGDTYAIYREGKEIKDSSGIVIGKLRSEIGSAKVSQVQDTFSIITSIEGTFKVNDLAISKSKAVSASAIGKVAPALVKGNAASTQRPRLAVGLIKASSTASTGVDVNKHIPAFTDTLISRLTQTKRFQLIDRQETDQLLDEQLAQAMAENRDLPSAMGQLKGADYIVIGSVANFILEERSTRLPGSSKVFVSNAGHVEGNMRIVDARTGDIIESRKISISQTVKKTTTESHIITELADAFAEEITMNLMNALYPIKVAAVVSDIAYINRGKDGGLAVGDTLRAIRTGQAIIDPDTGVELGKAETELGLLELIEVEEARSTARVNGLALRTGDLLKRISKATNGSKPSRTGGSADKPSSGALTLAVGHVKINPRGNNHRLTDVSEARITNDLMVKLSQFQEFDIMERKEIDQVLDEKAFTAIAGGDAADISLGELQGADYLIHAVIDDFMVRSEKKIVPYTDELQVRYFGTVEASLRLVDVHTGKVKSAIKVRLNNRIKNVESDSMATNDLIDQLTTEMATRISDDLTARQRGELVPIGRKMKPVRKKTAPVVRRPNF